VLALLDFANDWIRRGGLPVLALIVFAETGLFIGFALPGDSLLFFAGFLASDAGGHTLPGGLAAASAVAFIAAVAGDQVGYLIGHQLGPSLFSRPRSAKVSTTGTNRSLRSRSSTGGTVARPATDRADRATRVDGCKGRIAQVSPG
jgi:membrane protein DedA with SNARE-associated domain